MKVLKKNIDVIVVLAISLVVLLLTKNLFLNTSTNYTCLALFMMLIFFTSSLIIMKKIKTISVEIVFVIEMFLSGLLFVFINPFGQEPDGWVHFLRSVDVSYGNLLAPFWDNNGSGDLMNVPANIAEIGFKKIEINQSEAVSYMQNIKELYFSSKVVEMEGLGGFSSLFYLPQAIGLFIARMLSMSVYGHMVLGRIFNLLTYGSLTYIGFRKMPVFKNIYMVIALLPITIYQAASFSYDAMLMGLCFLFIALCMNYAYSKETLKTKHVMILGVILALLCLCKYVYVCLGILVFIIPMKKFEDKKSYWKAFFAALIPIVIILGLMALSSSLMVVSTTATSEVASGEVTQLDFIIGNPTHIFKVFISTFESYFAYHTEQISTLGWLNYKLGPLVVLTPVFMGMVSVLDTNAISETIKLKDRLLYIFTFGITVVMSMLGLYLMDSYANPVGSTVILGYQGRYTIPVLMLFLMTMSGRKVKNEIENFSFKVLSVMSCFMCLAVVMLIRYCY